MSAARYRRREKRCSREEPVWDRSRRDGTAKRIHRSDSKLIFLSWADRLRSLEKNRGRLWRAFLSLAPSSPSPFRLFRLVLPLSLFPPSMANDSCCDRCQDASLPRAITQWPPLFLRGYHAPIAESADPREIMDCHDALSITGPRTSADTPGYPAVSPFEILSRDDFSINRFWRGLERPSEAERQDILRVRWRI